MRRKSTLEKSPERGRGQRLAYHGGRNIRKRSEAVARRRQRDAGENIHGRGRVHLLDRRHAGFGARREAAHGFYGAKLCGAPFYGV
jgi:hypothetical protein